jgi:hypothetical protein
MFDADRCDSLPVGTAETDCHKAAMCSYRTWLSGDLTVLESIVEWHINWKEGVFKKKKDVQDVAMWKSK